MFISRRPNGEPEIFASIQGEGATCGVPSIFVRLALCNLRCGFCDTAYTWDWSRYDRAGEVMTLDPEDIEGRVAELAGESIRNVVLTGGEPLVQQGELAALASRLKARGFRLEVETNGTFVPEEGLARHIDQWNVSPKLASSGNDARSRQAPAALGWFAARAHAWWKLVVTAPQDLPEVRALVDRYGVPGERVILMPEGTDAATLAERSRWLAEACGREGFRLGPRLQVLLWGIERGR